MWCDPDDCGTNDGICSNSMSNLTPNQPEPIGYDDKILVEIIS